MLNAVLFFAVCCACAGACSGNRTAMALLVSTATGHSLGDFSLPLWFAIDVAVIAVIVSNLKTHSFELKVRDWLVLALFVPLWVFYFIPGHAGYSGSVLVCSVQMMMTFPLGRVWRRVRKVDRTFDPWEEFDLRVRHGAYE